MTTEDEIMLARSQVILEARRFVAAYTEGEETAAMVEELRDALAVLDGWRRRADEERGLLRRPS